MKAADSKQESARSGGGIWLIKTPFVKVAIMENNVSHVFVYRPSGKPHNIPKGPLDETI